MPSPKAASLLADMQKKFGENTVMMASEIPVGPPVSSGSIALDYATGYGGFPINRVVEIYGRPGTGKTTLALLTMANALKKYPKHMGVFMDVEHKVTKEWLERIVGEECANERIIYCQPTSIENATNVYRAAAESHQVCCAILDSIGGAPTVRRNDDAEVGHYGGNAMGVGEFARSAATLSATHNCLTIGINQVRANMGMGFLDETPGGHQWKHACVLRIELVKGKDTETIKLPGEEKPFPVGNTIFGKVRKNQVGAPGRQAMYWFYHYDTPEWGFGVDYLDEIARLGIMTQTFQRSSEKSGWYHHPCFPKDAKGEHKLNGINAIKELVRSDEKVREQLTAQIIASLDRYAGQVAPISDPEGPVDIISPAFLEGME